MTVSRILLAGLVLLALMPAAQAADTLNVLTWCDHEDPALLEPFEQANGVKINFKDIDSTAAILKKLSCGKSAVATRGASPYRGRCRHNGRAPQSRYHRHTARSAAGPRCRLPSKR